jgi:thiamine biosynthesis protein ThiS
MSEVRITVNGKPRSVSTGLSIASMLQEMGLDLGHVAVERNQEVIPRKTWPETTICDGDRIEVVEFMGGGSGGAAGDALVIGGKAFRSRPAGGN